MYLFYILKFHIQVDCVTKRRHVVSNVEKLVICVRKKKSEKKTVSIFVRAQSCEEIKNVISEIIGIENIFGCMVSG